MIVIVDYGLGNLASIKNMLRHIGRRDVMISSEVDDIAQASQLILPGVGAFDNGMAQLRELNLVEVLNHKAKVEKVPFLGICLGMQLMTLGSEEGGEKGLGWFNASTLKFKPKPGLKIPHMGWNYIKDTRSGSYFLNAEKAYRFYFVHSYYVQCHEARDIMFTADYGGEFHAGISQDNIYGMQFHPEKSLHFGMDVLGKFSTLS